MNRSVKFFDGRQRHLFLLQHLMKNQLFLRELLWPYFNDLIIIIERK